MKNILFLSLKLSYVQPLLRIQQIISFFLLFLFFGNCGDVYDYRIVRKKKTGEKVEKEAKSDRSVPESTKPEPIYVYQPVQKDPTPADKMYTFQSLEEWNRVPEGFLSRSIYQVKATSLKASREEAYLEAEEVAKKKATRMLIAEGVPYMTPESKVEIKIFVEESGRMVSDSIVLDGKYHFVFQVKKPALEIIVKEKLK